jgi:hypothetical protein
MIGPYRVRYRRMGWRDPRREQTTILGASLFDDKRFVPGIRARLWLGGSPKYSFWSISLNGKLVTTALTVRAARRFIQGLSHETTPAQAAHHPAA